MGAGRHEAPPANDPFMSIVLLSLLVVLAVVVVLSALNVPQPR
jgi:hypothetical protein